MTFITILNGPLLPFIHEHREPDKAGIDLGGRVHENIHMIILLDYILMENLYHGDYIEI